MSGRGKGGPRAAPGRAMYDQLRAIIRVGASPRIGLAAPDHEKTPSGGDRRLSSSDIGSWGEDMVAAYLQHRGWTVLHRNFRSGNKEIDLIVLHGEVVAFVEVRTRRRLEFGHPFDTIGKRKREAVEEAARAWVTDHGSDRYSYRFDAAAVTPAGGGTPRIEYVENAWS